MMAEIESRFNCNAIEFGSKYGVDIICERGGLGQALGITQTVPGPLAQHPDIRLRRDRLSKAVELHSHIVSCKTYLDLPLMLFIKAEDGNYWIKLDCSLPYEVSFIESQPVGHYEYVIPTSDAKRF